MNNLTQLPDEIGQLQKLRYLELLGNQLTALPPTLANLTQLCRLSLQNNQLRHLPAGLNALFQVTPACPEPKLFLDKNPLLTPPPDVVKAGMPTLLAYLHDPLAYYMRELLPRLAFSVGLLLVIILRVRRGQSFRQLKRSA